MRVTKRERKLIIMPLATYEDFLVQNPNCKKFTDDKEMRYTFEMLSWDYMLVQLLEASDFGKPAISPIVENIEHVFMSPEEGHINKLDDNFTKQAVGLIVKTILDPFGYKVWKQKDLPKKSRAEKFTSASVYRFDSLAKRTMRVRKVIEEIDVVVK
jgi:hypothetical protein